VCGQEPAREDAGAPLVDKNKSVLTSAAGAYIFKPLGSSSNRHIVQIFNQDQTHIYATILAIPNWRLNVTDKTVMTFGERVAGESQAIRSWFYPGANSGQDSRMKRHSHHDSAP
jgi:hypothetical protein